MLTVPWRRHGCKGRDRAGKLCQEVGERRGILSRFWRGQAGVGSVGREHIPGRGNSPRTGHGLGAVGHPHNKVMALGSHREGMSGVRDGQHEAPAEDEKGKGWQAYLPGLSSPAPAWALLSCTCWQCHRSHSRSVPSTVSLPSLFCVDDLS